MFCNLLKQNFKNSYRSISKPIVNLVFFVLIAFSLLLFSQELLQENTIYPIIRIVIWFSLLFSIFYQSVNFLREDYVDGTIEQMIIMCENLESYILAKIIVFWLEFCLPIILSSIIIMIIFQFSGEQIIRNTILLTISTIAICFISCLCASFDVISKRASLLVILALPLLIPVIIVAIIGNIQILLAISIVLSIISLFSCAKIIRIISE